MKKVILIIIFGVMANQIFSQDIMVQIDILNNQAQKTAVGSTPWGLVTANDLKSIVSYCMAIAGKPVLDSGLQFRENPILKVAAASRLRMNEAVFGQAIMDELIEKFELKVENDETIQIGTINILAINQEKSKQKNGGTDMRANGDWKLNNMKLNQVITFFNTRKLLIIADDEKLLQKKLTILVPGDLLTDTNLKKEEVLKLFSNNNIEAEILMKPKVFISN